MLDIHLLDASIDQWLNVKKNADGSVQRPDQIEDDLDEPPGSFDAVILSRVQGALLGLALGDALGACVEFRPRTFMVENPVTEMSGGGTWGLDKGKVGGTHRRRSTDEFRCAFSFSSPTTRPWPCVWPFR
jgi:hypothetical protein